VDYALLLPLAAFALDLAIGDPPRWPHPVRLIGSVLDRLEPSGQRLAPALRRLYGAGVALTLSLAAYIAAALLMRIPVLGWLFALYLAFAGLALGQLLRECKRVAGLIEAGDLAAARAQLSYLVSRDTSSLDEAELWRTLAETLSENFCDAFAAPAFYLFLGGPPLLWLYKTVSTMDSMWGYKTQRFLDLGWAGARADDLMAFIPARLSALALLAAGWALGLPASRAFANLRADARKMASPNAGWPMAAAAWLCGAAMGGGAVYFGRVVEKPALGPQDVIWDTIKFGTLYKLVISSAIGLLLLLHALLLTSSMLFS
jgi:adenosylcobinamide-phosphate synthase